MTAYRPILGAFTMAVLFLPCGGGLAAPLKQAKLIIDHNATDEDTGFQGFTDADGWESLEIVGPDGPLARFEGQGRIHDLGLTELFFETTEPENAKLPLADVLKMLPAGDYEFRATYSALGGNEGTATNVATLSHTIPEGTTLRLPKEGATLPLAEVEFAWTPVDRALDGSAVNIVAYQLIVEKDEEPPPRMIGKRGLSMYLPPAVTELTIAAAFFEPGTAYLWEVLAIDESGNQTLQSGTFRIE
jgi:hypothetical protein